MSAVAEDPVGTIVPLGDQACLVICANEEGAWGTAQAVRRAGWPWLVDVVSAYTTVGVYFDLRRVPYTEVERALAGLKPSAVGFAGRQRTIPCCYENAPDLKRVAKHAGLEPERVIELHTGVEYTVYAIGFCPGFPYLGYLPDELAGMQRLASPRKRVEVGSVGLTGRQTGVYTQATPGGWNLIGRTPLELVNVRDQYFPLAVGDRVRFTRIDAGEYKRLEGSRLPMR